MGMPREYSSADYGVETVKGVLFSRNARRFFFDTNSAGDRDLDGCARKTA
jgi:hypothetical protein